MKGQVEGKAQKKLAKRPIMIVKDGVTRPITKEEMINLTASIENPTSDLTPGDNFFIVFANYKWRPMLKVAGRFLTIEDAVSRADSFDAEYAVEIWKAVKTERGEETTEQVPYVGHQTN